MYLNICNGFMNLVCLFFVGRHTFVLNWMNVLKYM